MVTIALEADPFRAYAPFSALLPLFKYVLEIVFCEAVQHRLRFCLDHFKCVKLSAF
jgi:hypothetical protein